MKKKMLAVLLAMTMVLALAPMTVSADETVTPNTDWYYDHIDEDTFYIGTVEELLGFYALGEIVSLTNFPNFKGKTVKLTADIDLAGIAWKTPYTSNNITTYAFQGTFDGQNHTISNLTGQPFFGSVINSTVKNFILVNAKVTSNNGVLATQVASTGVIDNCVVQGVLTNGTGGITGLNAGTVSNCIAMVTINNTNSPAGGVANNNTGKIIDCAAFNDSLNSREASLTGRIAAQGTGTFTNNVAFSGMTLTGTNIEIADDANDKNGLGLDVAAIHAGGYLNNLPFEIPEYLQLPFVGVNQVNLKADQSVVSGPYNSTAGFALNANFSLDKVNLVEAVISYDKDVFDVNPSIPLENATVKVHKIDEESGLITFIIGVKNEEGIAYDEVMDIAKLLLTPKEGLQPDGAIAHLNSVAAYSKGVLVELDILNDHVWTALTYRSLLDVNGDGVIDAADLSLALYYFGAMNGDANWDEARFADVNGDGAVDMIDITILIEAIYGV